MIDESELVRIPRTILQYLKSRTVWLNIVTMLLAALNAYFEVLLDPAAYAGFTVIYTSIATWLRGKTTQAIMEK